MTDGAGQSTTVKTTGEDDRCVTPALLRLSADTAHTAPDDSASAAGKRMSQHSAAPLLQWCCRLGSRHTGPAPKRWEIMLCTLILPPTFLMP